MQERNKKSVQVFLRVKGPHDPAIKPTFKLQGQKIRFRDGYMSQQQEIMASYSGKGSYKFDKIYRDNCFQSQIFQDIAQDMIQSTFQGYNGTIFAYGQTGTGKTFTMTGGNGDPEDMGLIPRTLNYLFDAAQVPGRKIKIKLQYMQIYNNNAYDLFDDKAKISNNLSDLKKVHAFPRNQSFYFPNLNQFTVETFDEAIQKVKVGQANRIMRKTPNNDQSSRSHTLFMIHVITTLDTGLQRKALLNLVDLAGSQRVHNTEFEDQRIAKQGININLGLHHLGRVVMLLAEQGQGKDVHVPYRDSILTMALKSSMGGNCKTRMIATINPVPKFNPQSISTCKFAMQLTLMQNSLKKNQYIDPWVIIKALKKQVKQLKDELELLRGQEAKDVLDMIEVRKIREQVDKFISSGDPLDMLPIDNRLHIKQYLYYMKEIITTGKKKRENSNPNKQNLKNPQSEQQQEAFQKYARQVKSLKATIQKRDNQINLLLNIINDKKLEQEDEEGAYLAIEEVEQKNIALSITNALSQSNKPLIVSVQDVQKNLIKPLQIADEDDTQQAYSKFKDAHIQSGAIDQKQHKIKLKEMKKNQLLKKIQTLRHQRTKLNTEILKAQEIDHRKNKLPYSSEQIKNLRKELQELDSIIKRKYQQSKNLEMEISRLNLGRNKNDQKMKTQFNFYMGERRKYSDNLEDQQNQSNVDSEVNLKLQSQINQKKDEEDEVQNHLQSFLKQRNKIFNKALDI